MWSYQNGGGLKALHKQWGFDREKQTERFLTHLVYNFHNPSYRKEKKDSDNQLKITLLQNLLPPSVTNSGTRNACSLDRTLMNLLKSATLLRARNSSSLSLRSRGCPMFIRCSLCGHVIHLTVASSVTNAWLGSIRSSS